MVRSVFIVGAIVASGAMISLGFARLGEPQSLWLWQDVLQFCPGC